MQEMGLLSDPSRVFGTFHEAFGLMMAHTSNSEGSEKQTLRRVVFSHSIPPTPALKEYA